MVERIEFGNGTIEYRNKDEKRHRLDGPAVILSDGTEFWFKNGNLHRENGPSVIYPDGGKEWYKDGILHRRDGPSVIYPDGTKRWYKNGTRYSFNDWIELINIGNEKKMELMLIYG